MGKVELIAVLRLNKERERERERERDCIPQNGDVEMRSIEVGTVVWGQAAGPGRAGQAARPGPA